MGKLLDKIRGLRKPSRPFCTAVVVAAGRSERMGQDKLLLPLGDRPVLEHTLRAVDAAERVDEIIEHHGKRVKETEDLLNEHPGSSAYELAAFMQWNLRYEGGWENFPKGQKMFAASEVRAHLEYLACRGRVRKEYVDDMAKFYPLNKTGDAT